MVFAYSILSGHHYLEASYIQRSIDVHVLPFDQSISGDPLYLSILPFRY